MLRNGNKNPARFYFFFFLTRYKLTRLEDILF